MAPLKLREISVYGVLVVIFAAILFSEPLALAKNFEAAFQ
ncbi:hypothetical protein X975_25112, partial [Stegodyphus mimosarum]